MTAFSTSSLFPTCLT